MKNPQISLQIISYSYFFLLIKYTDVSIGMENLYLVIIMKFLTVEDVLIHLYIQIRQFVSKKFAVHAVDNGPDVRQTYKPSSGAGLFFLDTSEKS